MIHPDGIHSLDFAAYKSAAGVSKSVLDKIAPPKTPAHCRWYLDNPDVGDPTPAQVFGTIFHRACLEPDTMKGAFAVKPDGMNLATKEGKAWKAEQGDKAILSADDANGIERGVAALWAHPQTARLLRGAQFERSLFAKDKAGTLRKGRLDALTEGNAIPDVKTCESAALDDFERSILKYRYHVQAAYYLDLCALLGIEKQAFVFLCVEKSPPFAVAVYSLDADVIDLGRREYKRDLALFRQCEESGQWPGYSESIELISVPPWARKQLENL